MRIIGRPRAFIAVLASVALLAGCSSGPSQTSAAAIIGDRSVDLGAVQHEIQWLLDNVPAAKQAQEQRKLDAESRKIVQGRVVHELVTIAAEREGLSIDERELAELIEGSGGVEEAAKAIHVEPERVRAVAGDQVLLEQLGRKYVDRLSVTLVGTMITEESPEATAKDQAVELGRKIAADPARAADIVRENGNQLIDQNTRIALASEIAEASKGGGTGGEAAQIAADTATSAVFGTAAGSVLVAQPSEAQPGWLVALVNDRSTEQLPGAEGVAEQADPRLLYQVGVRLLQPIADEVGVRVNPRYGVWDPTAMSLAANENEVTGYQLQPSTVAP